MPKFDYIIVELGGSREQKQNKLNELGQAGWELKETYSEPKAPTLSQPKGATESVGVFMRISQQVSPQLE